MNEIIIYSKDICPFCVKAKEFFRAKGLSCKEINIGASPKLQQEMFKKSNGRKTVPQIFINDHRVGGYDDLMEAERTGVLKEYLKV